MTMDAKRGKAVKGARRTRKEVAAELRRHLAGGGTLNDCEVDELFREWHGIVDGRDTDLEEVERWAVRTA